VAGRPKTRQKRALEARLEYERKRTEGQVRHRQAAWEQSNDTLVGPNGEVIIRDEFPPPFHEPTQKQRAFWEACHDPGSEEILFDGAIRSGKTQAACKMIASWAWQYGGPNWKFVILRKTYRELEDSTKAAFLRGDGKMPPACPPALISSFKKADETAILHNGAEILFRSAENPFETGDKIRNVTIAGFMIDQVEELAGDDYFQLYETLCSRMSDPRGPGKALLVANPGPEDHWVFKRFVADGAQETYPFTRRVHVKLDENAWNLPERYIEMMKRRESTNNMWYKRFILGEWGAFGGKRFQSWDRHLHVVEPFEIPPEWEIVVGMDYGWSNPTCAIYCAIDFEGRWWVVGEHYEAEKPVSYHANAMKTLERDLHISPSSIWMDPSTWAKKSEYESPALEFADYGIFAGRAQNDRLGGWNRIDEMLGEMMEDGKPRLRIFNTCPNLIRELPSLRIKDGTDDVEKENDHAADALRYAIMSRMPHPVPAEEEDDGDLRARLARRALERASERASHVYTP
jgi:PBSX family phage terminase large subunit